MKKYLTIILEYWLDLLVGLVLVISPLVFQPFLGLSQDGAFTISLLSALYTFMVISQKLHLTNEIMSNFDRYGIVGQINSILAEIDGRKLQLAQKELRVILERIKNIGQGIIHLEPADYYHMIIERIKSADSQSEVYAISCIDPMRWKDDPKQALYLQENKNAALRGVRINRLFIIEKKLINKVSDKRALYIIKEQMKYENINVRIVWRETLSGQDKRIRDFVLFTKNPVELYLDYPDMVDSTRIIKGELIINQKLIEIVREDFDILCESAIDENEFLAEFA